MSDLMAELFDPFLEEAPRPPELVEVLLALRVQRIHLARRPLHRRDLLDVDEAALLDAHQQGVDGALGDVGESLVSQPRRNLVSVRIPAGEDRQDDALQRALEHLGRLFAHETYLLLSVDDYWYIVSMNTGR